MSEPNRTFPDEIEELLDQKNEAACQEFLAGGVVRRWFRFVRSFLIRWQ